MGIVLDKRIEKKRKKEEKTKKGHTQKKLTLWREECGLIVCLLSFGSGYNGNWISFSARL